MTITKLFALLTTCWAALAMPSYAASGSFPWSDSIKTEALNGGPSLQDVLNTLGYSINVLTDEVGARVFVPPSNGTAGEVTLKYRSSASSVNFGSYRKGMPSSTGQLFAAGTALGSKANLTFVPNDSLGFYIGPTLYNDTWYTQDNLNWDNFKHAKVFRTGTAGKYVIAWEDLPDGGDQDYNDYIIELRLSDPSQLTMSFVGNDDFLVCQLDSLCFVINCVGGAGDLTLSRLVNTNPTVLATGPSPLSYRYCFLPSSYNDSTYSLIFRVQDQQAHTLIDTFNVRFRLQHYPELTVNPDFIDTTICKRDTICFDAISGVDLDGDLVKFILVSGPGVIDSLTGRICFLPADVDSADYLFAVVASDSCCLSLGLPKEELPCPRDTVTMRVHLRLPPILMTINDTTINLCKPEQICFPVTATLPQGGSAVVYQDCGPGALVNNQLCFTPTAAGTYLFCFHAVDACGGFVRDSVRVTVRLNQPPVANAGRDSTLSQCVLAPICWAASCSDPDGDLASCTLVQGQGTYNGTQICFTPTGSGIYNFVLQATDNCGDIDYDTATINVTLKHPPTAQVRDTTVIQCNPTQICLPATCSDPDGDLVSCALVSPIGVYSNSQICFTPASSGVYQFILKATDACGLTAYDTGFANVTLNRRPQITPGGGSFTLCAPETICVPVIASDSDGTPLTITTTMGKVVNNSICLWSGGEGRRQLAFNVTVTDPCGASATALYIVNVTVNMTPIIQTPTPTAQTHCRATQLCFDVDAIDSIMAKLTYALLSGPGTIDSLSGVVCFTPQSSGQYNWQVIVRDSCWRADTGNVSWRVDFIPAPNPVVLPPSDDTVVCIGTVIDSLCFPFTYENDPQTNVNVTPDQSVVWNYTANAGQGTVCFKPVRDVNTTYSFTFRAVNQCHDTATSVYHYTVTYDRCDSSCLTLAIGQTACANLGTNVTVDITLEHSRVAIGGYDLLICYDVSALSFTTANIGSAINGWEYFTFRQGRTGNCSGTCPDGVLRLVAIADINNGAFHPPHAQFLPSGVMATITFRVTSDATFEGRVYSVEFFWGDCGDNAFSTVTGDTLLVDKIIYGPEHLIWDEFDEINFPESGRIPSVGVPDECMTNGKALPLRCIEFRNGFVCIIDSDSIDARGDINLNGNANEIADAVLFTNYFLKGISVFTISRAAQSAASDINADGKTLTVGDLVYLMRIIIGDALPYPKLSPFRDGASVRLQQTGNTATLISDCAAPIGGMYLQLKSNGVAPLDITKGLALSNVEVQSTVDGDLVNLIIYSKNKGACIPAGESELLTLNGACEIVHLEACDYDGNMLDAALEKAAMPTRFELGQNFPNPFNPATTITFSLPHPTEWTLSVVNVNGQVVKSYSGASAAGITTLKWDATDQNGVAVATGVYFYRLDAGNFTETRKMLLLK